VRRSAVAKAITALVSDLQGISATVLEIVKSAQRLGRERLARHGCRIGSEYVTPCRRLRPFGVGEWNLCEIRGMWGPTSTAWNSSSIPYAGKTGGLTFVR
jgi:hypothetical protein